MNMKELIKLIEKSPARSAWQRGVKSYAVDLLDNVEDEPISSKTLLNGADDWSAYSYGGCSWIYDRDIAEALCTPSELKKTRNGERNPNASETWLDCQARALHQACSLVLRLAKRLES